MPRHNSGEGALRELDVVLGGLVGHGQALFLMYFLLKKIIVFKGPPFSTSQG
jgi:hypothetical protein